MNNENNISMEAIKIVDELKKAFNEAYYNENFKRKRVPEEDIPFTKEEINILDSYNLDEIVKTLLEESNGTKRVAYFGSVVKKEDRRLVCSSLMRDKNYLVNIGSLKPLDIFAYKEICPVCNHENNTIYQIKNEWSGTCESCNHTYPFPDMCKCDFCTGKLNQIKPKFEEFFSLFGNRFKLINTIQGCERCRNEINSLEEAETFIDLYKRTMSATDEYFEIGEEWIIEPKEISDYDSFLMLYKKVQANIVEETNEEYNQIIVKIDLYKNLLIKFNKQGAFISQELS